MPALASRERLVVGSGLLGLTVLAWGYLLLLSSPEAESLAMAAVPAWSGLHLLALFLMWVVMMVAMMLPSAARMTFRYQTMVRRQGGSHGAGMLAGLFVGGYLVLWAAFGGAAALLQWGLYGMAVLTPAGRTISPWLGSAVLVTAGVYQWTPLKHACLRKCRSPLGFLMHSWRNGSGGALRMGLEHGTYCVGCCAGLMALLFVAGVMNLLWVVAVAALVLVEKLLPRGELWARTAGVALILAGIALPFL